MSRIDESTTKVKKKQFHREALPYIIGTASGSGLCKSLQHYYLERVMHPTILSN
jgi:hypothetical protein